MIGKVTACRAPIGLTASSLLDSSRCVGGRIRAGGVKLMKQPWNHPQPESVFSPVPTSSTGPSGTRPPKPSGMIQFASAGDGQGVVAVSSATKSKTRSSASVVTTIVVIAFVVLGALGKAWRSVERANARENQVQIETMINGMQAIQNERRTEFEQTGMLTPEAGKLAEVIATLESTSARMTGDEALAFSSIAKLYREMLPFTDAAGKAMKEIAENDLMNDPRLLEDRAVLGAAITQLEGYREAQQSLLAKMKTLPDRLAADLRAGGVSPSFVTRGIADFRSGLDPNILAQTIQTERVGLNVSLLRHLDTHWGRFVLDETGGIVAFEDPLAMEIFERLSEKIDTLFAQEESMMNDLLSRSINGR